MRVRPSPLTGRFDPSSILTELINFGLEYEENGCFLPSRVQCHLSQLPKVMNWKRYWPMCVYLIEPREVWQRMMVPHCKKSGVDDLLAPF